MVKTKTAKKKPARKATARKKKTSAAGGPLPPRQREKVLRKLRKMYIPPSHPSDITGPALALGYQAPMPKVSTAKEASAVSTRKTRPDSAKKTASKSAKKRTPKKNKKAKS